MRWQRPLHVAPFLSDPRHARSHSIKAAFFESLNTNLLGPQSNMFSTSVRSALVALVFAAAVSAAPGLSLSLTGMLPRCLGLRTSEQNYRTHGGVQRQRSPRHRHPGEHRRR
jgi:hypothetical protein